MKTLDDDDDDDEDDEFVEVPDKEGYEPYIPDHLRKEYGEFAQLRKASSLHVTAAVKQTNSDYEVIK